MTVLIILLVIACVIAGAILACIAVSSGEPIALMFSVLAFCVAIATVADSASSRAYRRGQIDAANGKIKFEKVQTDDGETVWREKSPTP